MKIGEISFSKILTAQRSLTMIEFLVIWPFTNRESVNRFMNSLRCKTFLVKLVIHQYYYVCVCESMRVMCVTSKTIINILRYCVAFISSHQFNTRRNQCRLKSYPSGNLGSKQLRLSTSEIKCRTSAQV